MTNLTPTTNIATAITNQFIDTNPALIMQRLAVLDNKYNSIAESMLNPYNDCPNDFFAFQTVTEDIVTEMNNLELTMACFLAERIIDEDELPF